MNNILGLVCFLLAGALAVLAYSVLRSRQDDWLPDELADATLLIAEKNLYTDSPFPVVGRPDRVYQMANKQLVPMEYKTRDREQVFNTDIAQLSLQAWLLRRNGSETAPTGYVVIKRPLKSGRKAIKVRLLSDIQCEQMIANYLDLISGKKKPQKAGGGKCKKCGHRVNC